MNSNLLLSGRNSNRINRQESGPLVIAILKFN